MKAFLLAVVAVLLPSTALAQSLDDPFDTRFDRDRAMKVAFHRARTMSLLDSKKKQSDWSVPWQVSRAKYQLFKACKAKNANRRPGDELCHPDDPYLWCGTESESDHVDEKTCAHTLRGEYLEDGLSDMDFARLAAWECRQGGAECFRMFAFASNKASHLDAMAKVLAPTCLASSTSSFGDSTRLTEVFADACFAATTAMQYRADVHGGGKHPFEALGEAWVARHPMSKKNVALHRHLATVCATRAGSHAGDPKRALEMLSKACRLGDKPACKLKKDLRKVIAQESPDLLPPEVGEVGMACKAKKICNGDATCVKNRCVLPGMVYVPAGSFTMGSDEGSEDERPQRKVNMSAYLIDQHEVTVAAYEKCVDAGACKVPWGTYQPAHPLYRAATWGAEGKENHPVNFVTWDQATAYCEWAGKSLPTEAQWEKAARGTDGRKFPWGDAKPTCKRANVGSCGEGLDETVPVGKHPRGKSPYGVMDMVGNVQEWVADRYVADYYETAQDNDPPGPPLGDGSHQDRVARGSYFGVTHIPDHLATRRSPHPTNTQDGWLGFRCAFSPK